MRGRTPSVHNLTYLVEILFKGNEVIKKKLSILSAGVELTLRKQGRSFRFKRAGLHRALYLKVIQIKSLKFTIKISEYLQPTIKIINTTDEVTWAPRSVIRNRTETQT